MKLTPLYIILSFPRSAWERGDKKEIIYVPWRTGKSYQN